MFIIHFGGDICNDSFNVFDTILNYTMYTTIFLYMKGDIACVPWLDITDI